MGSGSDAWINWTPSAEPIELVVCTGIINDEGGP